MSVVYDGYVQFNDFYRNKYTINGRCLGLVGGGMLIAYKQDDQFEIGYTKDYQFITGLYTDGGFKDADCDICPIDDGQGNVTNTVAILASSSTTGAGADSRLRILLITLPQEIKVYLPWVNK